jgi:molybdopterin-containing oxidoreductase family iron-sulfur binding subunit
MHWIRIDRYYSGEEDDPEMIHQPMLCQHCENAPCETVCPVLATVHSDEGLNLQIYNRCVGTRYCANNCPYKVRRFNFYEYTFAAYEPAPLQLVLNPDVTVREKGVMEKCSFCQQRIREGKERAKEMGRAVQDDDFQTACQQSCPTNAIHFGNMNNPESQVSQDMKDPRAFTVLQELNTLPSITYWTKLRHRDPKPWDLKSHQGNGHEGQPAEGHHS